jgi:hypothetical protein
MKLHEEIANAVNEVLTEIEYDADEFICAACGGMMSIPSELDPTAVCNTCAQAIAVIMAKFIRDEVAGAR